MKYALVLRPEAEEDIYQAYDWYEHQRRGLGQDFLLCLEAAFEMVKENPLQFPAIHGEIRRSLLRRFPYAVFFAVRGKTVSVLAVFHCRRDPQTWRQRVPK